MESKKEIQGATDLKNAAIQFSRRAAAMQSEVVWALGINAPNQELKEMPQEWVRNAIIAYMELALGNPKGPPAAELLNTQEKKVAAMTGILDAIETLMRKLPESFLKAEGEIPVGQIVGDAMRGLVEKTTTGISTELEAIAKRRKQLTVHEAVELERIKVKGMEMITESDSLQNDILVPRMEILYAIWHFWPQVALLPSVAAMHRSLEVTCKSQFSQKLTEKIANEIGLHFNADKRHAK